MIYPDDRYIDFETWANQLIRDAQIPGLRPFFPWQDFAIQLNRIPFFQKTRIPSPYTYKSWDLWAADIYKVYRGFIYG